MLFCYIALHVFYYEIATCFALPQFHHIIRISHNFVALLCYIALHVFYYEIATCFALPQFLHIIRISHNFVALLCYIALHVFYFYVLCTKLLRCAFMLYCPSCFLFCYVLCTPAISPHNSHIAQLRCAFMLIMRACPQNISVLLCKHKYAYVLVHCNKKRTLWEVLVYHKIRFFLFVIIIL